MSSGNDELEAGLDVEAKHEASRIFAMHCENFATTAKISQPQRKFRNHSENFAIPAKFSLCTFFAKLAKFTVHSKNLNFRYALYFLYDSEISLS